jgi:hypothetical protein
VKFLLVVLPPSLSVLDSGEIPSPPSMSCRQECLGCADERDHLAQAWKRNDPGRGSFLACEIRP